MTNEPRPSNREMQPEICEMQEAATREAPAPFNLATSPWARLLLLALLPGVVLALLGPFGSFGAPLWMRFAYWVPTMMAGAFTGAIVAYALERSPYFRNRLPATLAVLSTAVTVVMSGIAWSAATLIFGPNSTPFGPQFVLYVWIVTLAMMGVAYLIMERDRRIATASAPEPPQNGSTLPALDARLPPKLRGSTILALQAEDHYVRIHTELGSELILLRLSDAAAEMGAIPGARTHRSWWAAKSAVKSVDRRDGKLALILTNRLEVPVSRGYASELKQAGWLTQK